jgi:hypothetical protein
MGRQLEERRRKKEKKERKKGRKEKRCAITYCYIHQGLQRESGLERQVDGRLCHFLSLQSHMSAVAAA